MNINDSEHIYINGEYLNTHPDWHVNDSAWKAGHVLRIMQKNGLNPKHICEVGCGAGEILKQLQNRMPDDAHFDGFDVSPQAISLCKRRMNDNLHFHLGDLTAIPNAHYDLLLIMDVFEHVEDYMGFLRCAKSKATFHIFHIPLDLSIMTMFRVSSILRTRRSEGHLHYFIKETAIATICDCGYDIVDMHYTCGSIDISSKQLSARIMALIRQALFFINADIAAKILSGFGMLVLTR